jgi:hypothetical protein
VTPAIAPHDGQKPIVPVGEQASPCPPPELRANLEERRAKIERQTAELRTLGWGAQVNIARPSNPSNTADCPPTTAPSPASGR